MLEIEVAIAGGALDQERRCRRDLIPAADPRVERYFVMSKPRVAGDGAGETVVGSIVIVLVAASTLAIFASVVGW